MCLENTPRQVFNFVKFYKKNIDKAHNGSCNYL